MTNKSPAFQWYPKDILASARVQEMSLAEEGAYRRLIDFCWINGSVPSDEKRAARIIGKGATPEMAKYVLEMFVPHPTEPGKMVHERLEVERAKQEKNSQARKLASEARWNKRGTSADARGKQVKSKSDANGYANALQTESIAIATSSTNTFSSEKDISRKAANPPKESQDEYLIRKQKEYPALDVQAIFKRYIGDCKKKGIQPKRPFFDSWLDNEFEPLTADFENKSDLPTTDEVQKQREEQRKRLKNTAPVV